LAPEVPRLLHHAYASSVLADAYELHCAGAERTQLLRAFWGREATLFGDGIPKGKKVKNNKDVEAVIVARERDTGSHDVQRAGAGNVLLGQTGGLKAVLIASEDMERRKRTLASVRENLLGM
jgi:pumilio homology domain family member 6